MSAPDTRATVVAPKTMDGPQWLLYELEEGEPSYAVLLPGARLVAGRGSATDLRLRDPGASRRHFEIESKGDRLLLRDLGSKGGTFVNGAEVKEADLGASDVIEAGSSRLVALQVQPVIPPLEPGALEVVHYDGGNVTSRRVLDGPLVVGRLPRSDIVVEHRQVSRRHVEIRPDGPGATVVDLAPNNRVEVNGRRFNGSRAISPGDRIQLGGVDHVLVVESPDAHPGPVAIEVSHGGLERAWSVEVDAGRDSKVGEVASELASYLDLVAGGGRVWTLYEPLSGMVMHPDNLWVDSGVRRGSHLVLIDVEGLVRGMTHPVRYGPTRIVLSQLPRSVTPPEVYRARVPRPPEAQSLRGRGVSWQIVGGLGIILAGLIIALVRPAYAIFALVGGVVGIVSVGAGIMGEQSRRKHAVRQFRERLDKLDAELEGVRREHSSRLHQANPSPVEVLGWLAHRDRRLWERRPDDPDFLCLRIGTGRRASLIDTDDPAVHGDSPHAEELGALLDRHRYLDGVPILTPQPEVASVVGLVGGRRDVLEAASWLVVQAAALHAPAELEIAIPAVNQDWLWARWLPHAERLNGVDVTWTEGDALVLARRLRAEPDQAGSAGDPGPMRMVVVPHGAHEALADLLGGDQRQKTLYLVLADRTSDLPSPVDSVISVEGERAVVEGAFGEGDVTGPIRIDRLEHDGASRAAREMGRYVDGRRPARQTSSQLGLLDLLGIPAPDRVDVSSLWSASPAPPLSAVVGTTLDDEALVLGFRSDGVHGVVGGTTGSGKSEFLQTLLMSMALTHRPEQLSLFLIDFKGGASFTSLSELPHVAGVVTDLEKDASLANRAFTSLEAEMARRKKILDEARVPGLVEYERLPEGISNPVPALLVVIDEFALLVRQQPDVKERLDLVATQGRSLGVHLLLATQSPSNVVTPSIRSNTQVWISLRVVDDSESLELLGRPDAARISPDRPGRGFVRFGGSQSITGFQTARIARPLGEGSVRSGVSVRPFADVAPPSRSEPPAVAPSAQRTVTELEEVCRAVASQSRRLGIPGVQPLWLEPLPELLPAPSSSDGLVREPGRLRALVGLRDDPQRHTQEPFSVDLGEAGNLVVVGTRGSGKTSVVRQVVVDLAEQGSPAEFHFYGIESGTGSLAPVSGLPHCGAVVPVADRERLYRLFARLTREMERRRESLAASGYGDFHTWRRASAVSEPWVVMAIDDYPAFKDAADSSGLGLLNDQLLSLAQGGPAVGIHIVLTSSQAADMRTNLVNLFDSRILLRQVDAADYALLDLRLRPNEVPPPVPGRALVEGGVEMQVYASTNSRIEEVADLWEGSEDGPAPIMRLPSEVRLDEVAAASLPGRPLIGVGGDEHHPLHIDFDRSERHMLVAGEGRTGRSTTLLTLYESIASSDPAARFHLMCPRPSPLRGLVGRPGVVSVAATPEEISGSLRRLASGGENEILLIDDGESLPPEVGPDMEQVLREGSQIGVRSFIAARGVDIARSFETWARYLLSLRFGLLLMPEADGGLVLDIRLPALHAPLVPGRGFLCERGSTTLVQVALPSAGVVDPGSST